MQTFDSNFLKKIKKYSAVGNFCNLNFALVYTNKRGYNFIDRNANELLPLECSKVVIHSGGVIMLTDKRSGATTCVNSSFEKLPFISDNDRVVNFDHNGGLYGNKQEFSMSKPPYDGSGLFLIDIENDGVILHYDNSEKITFLYNLNGEVIHSADNINVLKKKDKGLVICDQHQIIDFAENIHLKLPAPSFSSRYYEHEKFRILGDHIWYSNKLLPLAIRGYDSRQFNEDGSIIFYNNDKYLPYCNGPDCGTVIQIKSYTNKNKYSILYGEYELDRKISITAIKDIRPHVSDWRLFTLDKGYTVLNMDDLRSEKIINIEKECQARNAESEFKDNLLGIAAIIIPILIILLIIYLM